MINSIPQFISDIAKQSKIIQHDELKTLPVEEIIYNNVAFAIGEAFRYAKRFNSMHQDDIIEAAFFGLTEAANRWDPDKSKFPHYCKMWVKLEVKSMYTQDSSAVSKHSMMVHINNKINRYIASFLLDNEREPTEAEIKEYMDLPDRTFYTYYNRGIKNQISFDQAQKHGTGSESLTDGYEAVAIEQTKENFENEYNIFESSELAIALRHLDPNDEEAIRRIYLKGAKMGDVIRDVYGEKGYAGNRKRITKALKQMREILEFGE